MMSRRAFLTTTTAGAAAGSLSALLAQSPRQQIVSVKVAPLQLLPASRFGRREFTGDHDPARSRWFGPFSQLTGTILVQIRTDQGITGYGLGGGGGAAIYIIENHLRDLLLGADARNVQLLWDQIFSSTSFYGRKGVVVQALSGIDLALWDVAGKALNQPVWRMLGGAAREKTRAYFTGNNVELGLKLGFSAFKLPVDVSPHEGSEAMQKAAASLVETRRLIGPDALLMIDVLCRWNVEYTIEFARRAEEAKLFFLEEPLLPDDLAGYERLCREVTSTKIASGEHEFTHYGFDTLLRLRAAQVLQPDLTWSGGLTTGLRVAELAASRGVPVAPHRGGSVYGMQLIAHHPACILAESFGTGEPGNEVMAMLTAPYQAGYYLPVPGPGCGVDWTTELLRSRAPSLL
jgi:L-rhamnonate dehydratase